MNGIIHIAEAVAKKLFKKTVVKPMVGQHALMNAYNV